MAIPSLVLALVLVSAAGPSILNMIWVISLGMWPGVCRMVCGLVRQVKKEHYIQTAVMTGLNTGYIFRRHIVPSVLPPLLVMITLGMGRTILMTSSLGFLGLGIVAPAPDWGAMLNSGAAYIRTAPHMAVFPGMVISVTVLCFNLLGERAERTQTGTVSRPESVQPKEPS
jgi:peptide/nickel transport system permease protein